MFGTTVWDQGTSCLTIVWTMGPGSMGVRNGFWDHCLWDHVWDHVWDHGVWDPPFCLGPPFGTMGVWVSGTSCLLFGTKAFRTIVWDHACLGPALGPWVFVSFGTTVWDHVCLGPWFGTMVWDQFGTMWVFGRTMGVWWAPTTIRVWDHGSGTSCLGPWVFGFGTTVWEHRLGPWVFGTRRFVWDHRLGPCMFGTHDLGPCVFGTMVWDHRLGPGCLGPTGTMGLGPAVWDHGCSGPAVWDHTVSDHCLGPCMFGPPVWDHGCLFRLGPPFGAMGVWDPQFGTMRVWDHASFGTMGI